VRITIIRKDSQYLLNHCARYLARDNQDERHVFVGSHAGEPRGLVLIRGGQFHGLINSVDENVELFMFGGYD
jgi:hypothetical protein